VQQTKENARRNGDQLGSEGSDVEFILFTTDRDNPSILGSCRACEEIYMMLPDGSNQTRLTSNNFNDGGAVWSREAKAIAFHTNRRGGYPQIFLMNADGSDQRLLADAGVNEMGEQLGAAFPSWSPDGDRICFSNRLRPSEIFIVDTVGGRITNLTLNSADDSYCNWSPRGDKIVFVSTRDGNEEIYVMNADGSDPVRLTVDAGKDEGPAWSPDGARIAFKRTRDGNAEIYVMNADGTDPIRLTNFEGEDRRPCWSPKGDKIVFDRRIAGHGQVFTMNADGTDVTQLTFGTTIEFSAFPSWGVRRLDQ
jgi:TolB protein